MGNQAEICGNCGAVNVRRLEGMHNGALRTYCYKCAENRDAAITLEEEMAKVTTKKAAYNALYQYKKHEEKLKNPLGVRRGVWQGKLASNLGVRGCSYLSIIPR